ncbi:putative nuclease HARBI1 isoform X3 [Tachysurus vachellii]|nr:putative nuclease HARBI1 isoform X3 [Tachysurus vachellii]
MENLALESQIKKRTIRKLDLEIKKLEREIVCNADCVISNVVAKWPGSVHDSRIFRASEIYQHLSQGEFSGVLLGDRGYGCQPFLLTPFTDPQEAGLQPRPCPDQGQS